MIKKIICIIFMLSTLSLTGCGWNKYVINTENNDNRMTLIYNDGVCQIYVDNETGVQYLNGNGISVMVDKNGEPLIYNIVGGITNNERKSN